MNIFKLAILKYRRCYLSILKAIISQQGCCQIFREIHMCESLGILPGNLIIAGPEFLLFLIGKSPNPILQNLYTVCEYRKCRTRKWICVYPHLFSRGTDDPHSSSFIFKPFRRATSMFSRISFCIFSLTDIFSEIP